MNNRNIGQLSALACASSISVGDLIYSLTGDASEVPLFILTTKSSFQL